DVAKVNSIARHLYGFRLNMKLLLIASDRVDFCHSLHGQEPWLYKPLLEAAQFHQLRDSRLTLGRYLGLNGVEENFSQTCANRTQFRLRTLWKLFRNRLDAFRHELTRSVNIGPILKDDCHLRETKTGNGPDLGHTGKATHRRLDRI